MDKHNDIVSSFDKIDARNGLPEEIFLAVSCLVPIANIDLLIMNEKNQILLSWRNDIYFGTGWHLPGGCIRFKETMSERIQKTALEEIGTEVIYDGSPIAIKDVIIDKEGIDRKVRAHHLAVLYLCSLPNKTNINNNNLHERDAGFLKWFTKNPKEIITVHECYFDIFKKMGLID